MIVSPVAVSPISMCPPFTFYVAHRMVSPMWCSYVPQRIWSPIFAA